MGFSEVVQSQDALWDYGILVTSLEREWENLTLAQLYRDRGDAENTFDELKTEGNCSPPIQAPKTPQQFQSQLLCQDASFTFGYDDLRRQILILSLRL